jgi:hypothetical protein
MRPQAENLAIQNLDFSSGYTIIGITDNGVGSASPLTGVDYREFRETATNAAHGVVLIKSGQVNSVKANFELILKPAGGRRYFKILNNGGGGGSLTIDTLNGVYTQNQLTNETKLVAFGDGSFYVAFNYTPNSTGNFNVQIISVDDDGTTTSFLGDTSKGFEIVGFTLTIADTIQGIIPNDTSSYLTRSANTFSFTDLVTKQVFSADEWSVFINIDNMQANSSTGAFLLFTGTGLDMYLRALTATRFNFWNQEAAASIGNVTVTSVSDNHKFIVTYKNGLLNIYLNDARIVNNYASTFQFTSFQVPSTFSGFSYSYDVLKLAACPIALTEAEAIAELNSL